METKAKNDMRAKLVLESHTRILRASLTFVSDLQLASPAALASSGMAWPGRTGWEHLHVAINHASGLRAASILRSSSTMNCPGLFRLAVCECSRPNHREPSSPAGQGITSKEPAADKEPEHGDHKHGQVDVSTGGFVGE